MAMEHIVRHTCRFNVKNPQHKRINEVLANLNSDVCKSKSQFMIDAIEYCQCRFYFVCFRRSKNVVF